MIGKPAMFCQLTGCHGPCTNGRINYTAAEEGTFRCVCYPGFYGKYCEKGRCDSSVKPEGTILVTTSRECHPNTFFTLDPVHAPYPGTGMYVTPGELGLNMLSCSLPTSNKLYSLQGFR